ncbi:gliding motility-associated C-terminal domain-containing protein [Reichenbachiella carrageenanivorans]|uniref:Gliding motility-associated C-terminal domain-containing protein n=1 Tax=Reichenbachiella carrageenanivorans TaxID=2979869 RepID=A0ABY6CY25_9BACT|nr:gliding motility-associated C-terminal domain-containing protein [Reichenbachiella carrageenanivorans]UXX78812.1 gliding motility-associated C-terminal domain-containing protein [Reichenbachiella carrageenanivorans]
MRKLLLILTLALLSQTPVIGFHIVGGEIELIHISGNKYQLHLIQYFDKAQIDNPGPDPSVEIYIFRNSDHTLVQTHVLLLDTELIVPYTNPDCAIGSLQTSRVLYSADISLNADTYNEIEGYYASWERCCRNTNISNIVNPGGQGITYTLDFPAVVRNGKPFINSSPQLFPPLSDYACVNQTYYTNFAGTDPDGDSIAYSLQLPYNSSSQAALPIPQPKPFIELIYANGSNINNIIPGSPSLQITPSGYLTVTPTATGLYVFSVLVEEYRNKEKIGELRRDFQMLVIDGCEPPTPPHAEVRLPGEKDYYIEGEVIHYSASADKCFEYMVVDQAGENVTFKAEGVNFDEDVSEVFEFSSGPINPSGDTLRVEVCISDCPYIQHEPYIIDLIASDNACPLPQRDTVRMTINVEAPVNNKPYFDSPSSSIRLSRTQPEGLSVALDELLIGKDAEDSLHYFFYAEGYDPINYGMSLDTILDVLGEKQVKFNWNTSCQTYPFGDKNTFELGIVLEDYDTCLFDSGDTLFYDLEVVLPPNTTPQISGPSSTYTKSIRSNLDFNVMATDDDNDPISLTAIGDSFSFPQVGISFANQKGTGQVSSLFAWELSCENLNIEETTTFTLYFMAEDDDYCQATNNDTLAVTIQVQVPANTTPAFEIEDFYSLQINKPFELEVIARDGDNADLLTLDLLSPNSAPSSESFSFSRATGTNTVSSTLNWTPECSLLGEGNTPKTYPVDFLVFDDNCPQFESASLTVNFEISELDVDYGHFLPPNAFSPNNDGHNDTYTLTHLEEEMHNLPPDNCADQFQSIIIFDRNGSTIFKSTNREFEWTGDGADVGVYFYQIEYQNTNYKGTLTLVR